YEYLQNADVIIDGGAGVDSLVVTGTPIGDLFVVAKNYLAGAGRYVTFENIERIELNAAAGDDEIYVVSTSPTLETVIRGGSGNDVIHMGGDHPFVELDPPEFLFEPEQVLRQDVRKIYPILHMEATARGPLTYNTWVDLQFSHIDDDGAWYYWSRPFSYWSIQQEKLEPRELTNLSVWEDFTGTLVPDYFATNLPLMFVWLAGQPLPDRYHVQNRAPVQGYYDPHDAAIDYTYFVDGDSYQQSVVDGIWVNSLTQDLVAWDDRDWDDHKQARIASVVSYTLPSFDYIDTENYRYKAYTATTPPPLWVDPNKYYVQNPRIDDLDVFQGKLTIDGGSTIDGATGQQHQDKVIVRHENGAIKTGTLGSLYNVQVRDAQDRLLFEAAQIEGNDELGGYDITPFGNVAANDEWAVTLDGIRFSIVTDSNDTLTDINTKLRTAINQNTSFSAAVRTESGTSILNVRHSNNADLSVSASTTNSHVDREEITGAKFGSNSLATNDVVVSSNVALQGFGMFQDQANGVFGPEFANLERLELRLTNDADTLTIDGSISGLTEVAAGGGDDTIYVQATGGAVDILGGAGDDTVEVGDATHSLDQIQGNLNFKADAHRTEVSTGSGVVRDTVQIEADGKVKKTWVDFTQAEVAARFQSVRTPSQKRLGIMPANISINNSNYFFTDAAVFNGIGNYQADADGNPLTENGRILYRDQQTELQHGTQIAADGSLITNQKQLPKIESFQVQMEVRDTLAVEERTVTESYIANVSGAGTNDQLIISDAASSSNKTGQLTSTALSGLGMAHGSSIQFSQLDDLAVTLGSGSDSFTIESTY
ncbi:MAG: hypothetical protein KDA87_15845, partial [Planctomycetales bacterium]|nr:hypothetical protein [Planctomycetales bacterium]